MAGRHCAMYMFLRLKLKSANCLEIGKRSNCKSNAQLHKSILHEKSGSVSDGYEGTTVGGGVGEWGVGGWGGRYHHLSPPGGRGTIKLLAHNRCYCPKVDHKPCCIVLIEQGTYSSANSSFFHIFERGGRHTNV